MSFSSSSMFPIIVHVLHALLEFPSSLLEYGAYGVARAIAPLVGNKSAGGKEVARPQLSTRHLFHGRFHSPLSQFAPSPFVSRIFATFMEEQRGVSLSGSCRTFRVADCPRRWPTCRVCACERAYVHACTHACMHVCTQIQFSPHSHTCDRFAWKSCHG